MSAISSVNTGSSHNFQFSVTAGCSSCGASAGSCSCDKSTSEAITSASKPMLESAQSDAQKQQKIQELKQTDQEVRAHEAAHVSAGGQYVQGGAHYTTVTGPDNQEYAVAGEVNIDTAPIPGDPDATIEKAKTVRRAALAPANPSAQDQQVAAQAAQMETVARMEKLQGQGQHNRIAAVIQQEDDPPPDKPPRHAIQAYENASSDYSDSRSNDSFSAFA